MKRNHNLRKLKAKKSYSTAELAEQLCVHPQTIRQWREAGLEAIDPVGRSPLFLGSQVQQFLSQRRLRRRVKLSENEFYCFGCQTARISHSVQITENDRHIGSGGKQMVMEGICIICGRKVNKFIKSQLHTPASRKVINRGLSSTL